MTIKLFKYNNNMYLYVLLNKVLKNAVAVI